MRQGKMRQGIRRRDEIRPGTVSYVKEKRNIQQE